MKKLLIIMFFAIYLNAKSITGIGFSEDEIEARNYAFADLSNQISTEVLSEFNSLVSSFNGDLQSIKEKLVQTKSELPIIGVKTIYKRDKNTVEVVLDSKNSLYLYEENLKNISNEINKTLKLIDKENDKTKLFELYSNLQLNLAIFNKYKIVALILESKKIPILLVSENEIKMKLSDLTSIVESIDLAAKLISKPFNEKKIFIYPAKNGISSEITPFSKLFKQKLSKRINQVYTPIEAKFFLSGSYEILKDKIYLSYTLIDKENKILKQNGVTLSNKAYEGIEIKPKSISFDEEIHNGFLKSSDLKIDISFKSYGSKDILLFEDDLVNLVVRTNKPVYFYLVGHILHNENRSSYLIELQPDAYGKNKFIYRLGGSDVNIPISLGEFEISEPFGFESIQMFASTKDIINDIPNCTVDEHELCVIGDDPTKVISTTRALIRPKKSKKETLKAEAILEYTTVKK